MAHAIVEVRRLPRQEWLKQFFRESGGNMSVHGSKNWRATESTDFGGGNRKLRVTGEVEVGASNEEPVLTEANPQGINPKILILELSTRTAGDVGADVLTCKDAAYEKNISEDQYSQVDIRDQALVDVEKLIS